MNLHFVCVRAHADMGIHMPRYAHPATLTPTLDPFDSKSQDTQTKKHTGTNAKKHKQKSKQTQIQP